jgi:hypothetical protein
MLTSMWPNASRKSDATAATAMITSATINMKAPSTRRPAGGTGPGPAPAVRLLHSVLLEIVSLSARAMLPDADAMVRRLAVISRRIGADYLPIATTSGGAYEQTV